MTYKAIVTKITTRKLEGADRLLIGQCGNYQVVVGIGVQDGQLGVFFESDGQLSEEFATKNDLIRRKNEDGSPAGGMFEPKRRVKAIKLRGARSEGFWCPLSLLEYTGADLSSLKEGDEFDSLNGHLICNKYVTAATQARGSKQPKTQCDNKMFAKHVDTGMFKREFCHVPDGSILYFTEKLHGTSQRLGVVLDDAPIKRGWLGRLVAKIMGWPQTQKEWTRLIGSRNVILQNREGDGFYGQEQFRFNAVDGIALHKGEILYGEIVGYTENGAAIMSQNTKDKTLTELYGQKMDYSYGCCAGQCEFFVYRITQVNEDGIVVERSWPQVKQRCRELGIKHVPELAAPMVVSAVNREVVPHIVFNITENSTEPLPSTLDKRHIREGVVVRWESERGTGFLKNKGFAFKVLEGIVKDDETIVDMEEAS